MPVQKVQWHLVNRGRQLIHAARQFTFQIRGLVFMDHPFFGESIYEGSNFGHFFACCFRLFDSLQVTDSIPGCFAIITVAVPAFGGLPYVLFCCPMISHAFRILDGKGRKISQILKNIPEVSFADICQAI